MDALQREKMGHVPTNESSPLGPTLGSGTRCLRIQMPHVEYRSKSIAASFWLSPFPIRNQLTPQCSRRQLRFSSLPPESYCNCRASRIPESDTLRGTPCFGSACYVRLGSKITSVEHGIMYRRTNVVSVLSDTNWTRLPPAVVSIPCTLPKPCGQVQCRIGDGKVPRFLAVVIRPLPAE